MSGGNPELCVCSAEMEGISKTMEKLLVDRKPICITTIIFILSLFFTSACGPPRRGDLQAGGYIDIERVTSPHHLKEGDRFFITYKKWGSVGLGAVYEIEDPTVVSFVEDITWHKNPLRVMPGSDEGSGCFIFRALKKGETKLVIWEDFRGEKNKELKSITIVVE
jgi:hypothetical protein